MQCSAPNSDTIVNGSLSCVKMDQLEQHCPDLSIFNLYDQPSTSNGLVCTIDPARPNTIQITVIPTVPTSDTASNLGSQISNICDDKENLCKESQIGRITINSSSSASTSPETAPKPSKRPRTEPSPSPKLSFARPPSQFKVNPFNPHQIPRPIAPITYISLLLTYRESQTDPFHFDSVFHGPFFTHQINEQGHQFNKPTPLPIDYVFSKGLKHTRTDLLKSHTRCNYRFIAKRVRTDIQLLQLCIRATEAFDFESFKFLLFSWRDTLTSVQLYFSAGDHDRDPNIGFCFAKLLKSIARLPHLKHLLVEHNLHCYRLADDELLEAFSRLHRFYFSGPNSSTDLVEFIQKYGQRFDRIGIDCRSFRDAAASKPQAVPSMAFGPKKLPEPVPKPLDETLVEPFFNELHPNTTQKFSHFPTDIFCTNQLELITAEKYRNLVSLDLTQIKYDPACNLMDDTDLQDGDPEDESASYAILTQILAKLHKLVHIRLNVPLILNDHELDMAFIPSVKALDLIIPPVHSHDTLFNCFPAIVAPFRGLVSLHITDHRYACLADDGTFFGCPYRQNPVKAADMFAISGAGENMEFAEVVIRCRNAFLKEFKENADFLGIEDFKAVAVSKVYPSSYEPSESDEDD